MKRRKKIVVIGAGFGGLVASIKIARALRYEAEVILVDRKTTHTYTPWLYDVATSFLIDASAKHIHELKRTGAFSIPEIIRRSGLPNLHFRHEEFDGCNKKEKYVIFSEGGTLHYDYLILALGAQTTFFGIPGMREFALTLKTIEDGLKMRERLHHLLLALKERGGKTGRIAIIGAGPTGVETAAELANFVLECRKRGLDYCKRVHVSLYDAGDRILNGFQPAVSHDAKKRLKQLDVEIISNALVNGVTEKDLTFTCKGKKSTATYDVLLFAGGIEMHPMLLRLPFLRDDRGRIRIDAFLRILGEEDVFAIGDCMSFTDEKKKSSLPPTAWAAVDAAPALSRNIVAAIRELPLIAYEPPKVWPGIVTIGGAQAAGGAGGLHLRGFPAFLLRRLVDLRYFLLIFPPSTALKTWIRGSLTLSKND